MAGSDVSKRRLRKALIRACKIGIGSSLAIWIAKMLGLPNPTSAGSIALLTILATRNTSFHLIVRRYVSYFFSMALAFLIFPWKEPDFVTFMLYIIVLVLASELFDWEKFLPVNALIAMRCLNEKAFTWTFFGNELAQITIGILIATLVNLFYQYRYNERALNEEIRKTDLAIQAILRSMANRIRGKLEPNLEADAAKLHKQLRHFKSEGREYTEYHLGSTADFYVNYFEMREKQLDLLESLFPELKSLKGNAQESGVVAGFLEQLASNNFYKFNMDQQIEAYKELLTLFQNSPLPASREEFEERAVLYNVLFTIHQFLLIKKNSLDQMSERQIERYWKSLHKIRLKNRQ